MRYFELGKTGLMISEVGFGGIPIIRLDTDAAVHVLRRAHEQGITLYDTANAYRDSEEKIGRAFQGMRDKVVIATKTIRRDAATASDQIDNSLRMLRTDYIDLFQLHQIAREEEWQAVTAPGGAMEAVVKAKEAGKVRHIGVTSHSLEMALKLVRTGLFSTVQFPFNLIETDAAAELFPVARELGVGILAMKPFAGGVIDNGALAFKFLRQYPDAIPLPGFDSVRFVDEIVGLYGQPNLVTDQDNALMDEYRTRLGKAFCRRCEYCQPCPKEVKITMAMGYPIFVSRMGP
ncbi:MAG TPA: aldo/keto reductase, partial [Geobacteraceae bacterium]|nr:aldo/keto reductase [Geobacteraceae bacterium]